MRKFIRLIPGQNVILHLLSCDVLQRDRRHPWPQELSRVMEWKEVLVLERMLVNLGYFRPQIGPN